MRRKGGRELLWDLGAAVWRAAVGGLTGAYGAVRAVGCVLWVVLFGGGLVEGAQKLGLAELLGSMPDPTQDAVGGGEAGGAPSGEGAPGGEEGQEESPPPAERPQSSEEEEEEEGAAVVVAAPPAAFGGRKDVGHYRMAPPDAPGGLGDIGEPPGAEPPTPEGTPILRRKIGVRGGAGRLWGRGGWGGSE